MRMFKAKMFNFKVPVVFLVLSIGFAVAEEKCTVSNIDFRYQNYANSVIKDTHNGIVVTFNTTNVLGASLEIEKYLTLEFKNDVITISTKDFENYEKHETNRTLKDILNIKCADKLHKINFQQPITFTNNHSPEFSKKEYKFVLYGQLKKGLDLTNILKIESTDFDIDSGYPSFNIFGDTNDLLKISVKNFNQKTTSATLKTNKLIFPPFDEEFTITVYDDYYEPNHSANATLKIIVKAPEGFESEEFKYEGEINEKTNQITTNKPIKMEHGVDYDMIVNLQSEYAKYFTTYLDVARSEIKLKLIKDLPHTTYQKSLNKIDIDMDVLNNGIKSNLKVVLNLDKDIKENCKLGDINLKESSYKNPNAVNDDQIGTILKIDDTFNVKKVTCTGTKYLNCEFTNQVLTVSTTEEFRKYEEKETESSIEMKMVVECPDDKAEIKYIQNIKNINNHAPEFNKKEYSFVFHNYLNKNLKLHQIMPIKATDIDLGWTCMDFKISDNEYFKITSKCSSHNTSEAQIVVLQDIYAPKKLKLNLEVTDNGSPSLNNSAVLNVDIKTDFTTNLVFTQQKYLTTYKNSTTFFAKNPIQLENGFDEYTNFELKNSTYSKYFNIKPNLVRNCVEILPKPNIEEISEDYIVLSVIARWKGFWNSTDVQIQFTDIFPENDIPQIHSNLNGFYNWLNTSMISQMIVSLVALIAVVTMIFALRYYVFKK